MIFSSLFLSIFLTSILVFFLWLVTIYLSFKVNPFFDKLTSYECGFDPLSGDRSSISLGFFVVCIIFLLFSVEVVMVFPVVHFVKFCEKEMFVVVLVLFLFLLLLGLLYEWKKGALEWFN